MNPQLWKFLAALIACMAVFTTVIMFYVAMMVDSKPSQQSVTYSCDASYYCYVVEPQPDTNTRQA